jgi:hypothetical protein
MAQKKTKRNDLHGEVVSVLEYDHNAVLMIFFQSNNKPVLNRGATRHYITEQKTESLTGM